MSQNTIKNEILGLEVKRLMKQNGLTQKLLASRTEVDPAYINMIIAGKRRFRLASDFAKKLSEALGVHLSHWAQYTSDGQIAGISNVPLQQLENLQLQFKMLGYAAAGKPIDPDSPIERTISFGEFFKGDDIFVVEAIGDSMIESHICDGDFVIIRRNSEPENNTIVVANVCNADTDTGGLTIKRLKDNQLVPENGDSDVPPIDVTSSVQILGTFTGVIRKSQPAKQRKAT